MSKIMMWLFVLLAWVAGPPLPDRAADERWDVKEGYVVAKEDGRVLAVRDKVPDRHTPLNRILEEAMPNAIWLTVSPADYHAVEIGDHIGISIPNGAINQSYPAQAAADVKKLNSP